MIFPENDCQNSKKIQREGVRTSRCSRTCGVLPHLCVGDAVPEFTCPFVCVNVLGKNWCRAYCVPLNALEWQIRGWAGRRDLGPGWNGCVCCSGVVVRVGLWHHFPRYLLWPSLHSMSINWNGSDRSSSDQVESLAVYSSVAFLGPGPLHSQFYVIYDDCVCQLDS